MNNITKKRLSLSALIVTLFIMQITVVLAADLNADKIIFVQISENSDTDSIDYSLKELGVLDTSNLYYLYESEKEIYLGESDNYDEPNIYTIETFGKFSKLIYKKQELTPISSIPYSEEIEQIKIYANEELIIDKQVNFCNHNKKCESCSNSADTSCKDMESSLTCPSDCTTGSDDNYCDLAKDDICDPDCEGHDMDCLTCSDPESDDICYYNTLEYACMYEYHGVNCKSGQKCAQEDADSVVTMKDGTLCCIDSYCISETSEPKKQAADEEIEKYVELEKGTEEETQANADAIELPDNITTYGIYLLVFVAIAIIIWLIFWLKEKTTETPKNKSQITSLDLQITQLHAHGMNYSKIKQQMIRKGYHEDEIDKAIEQHFKTRK